MEIITAYKCSFCGKLYKVNGTAERHEKYCGKNPENQYLCLNCRHLKKERDYYGVIIFSCKVQKNRKMHTHVALRRKLDVVKKTELMPMQCNDFNYSFNDFEYE